MAEERRISEEYQEIVNEVLHKEPEFEELLAIDLSIVALASNSAKKSKGAAVLGECEKVPGKYKWGLPCDITITFFEPNIRGLSDKQMYILAYHELLHIGITDEGEIYIRNHDLSDFKTIIDKYGTDWAKVE